jgi:transposase-like protein
MTGSEVVSERAPRHRWTPSEKRRIVELTLRDGASISAIAREHGVHHTSLSHWRKVYGVRAPARVSPVRSAAPTTTLVPVKISPRAEDLAPNALSQPASSGVRTSIVQLTLSSGTSLRIETGLLDTSLVCALLAQVQR